MKTLLKLSAGIVGLIFASYVALVVGYHCSKSFRWAVKDFITQQQDAKDVDSYLAKGMSEKGVEKMMVTRSLIRGEFDKIARAYEPEFIPFQVSR